MTRVTPNLQQHARQTPPRKSPSTQPQSPTSLLFGAQAIQLTPTNIPGLQRSIGNRAVQNMLSERTTRGSMVVQPKLKVGAANDRYEAEADRVAGQVMRSMESTPAQQRPMPPPHTIQRLPAPQVGAAGGPIGGELETRIQGAAKGGKSVQPEIRRAVENATGADLSGVRYHDDKDAHGINAELGAKAATHKSHIFLGAGQSPHNVQLMAHELTHTVQQGAPQVQRWFGKKQKPTSDATMFDTGKAPTNAFFTVRAAVKMGTANRGADSLKTLLAGGAGHSWLEIELGPAFQDLTALANDTDGMSIYQVLEDSTKQELAAKRKTTIGFYPDIRNTAFSKSMLAKQIASDLPGHLLEPEQASFAGQERGAQGFPITDVAQAIDLFSFIQSYRARPYNVFRNNCTDFVNNAIKRIGYSMGKVSASLGITLPTLLYKQMYKRSELGDRSVTHTALENKTNKAGKLYDVKHLKKSSEKKLNKQKAKVAPMLAARAKTELWARAIETYTAPGFIAIKSGGMTRPRETVFGVTGVVNGKWGEAIIGDHLTAIDLMDFENNFGFPYPEVKAAETDKPVDQELIEELNNYDADDIEQDVDEEENGRGMINF